MRLGAVGLLAWTVASLVACGGRATQRSERAPAGGSTTDGAAMGGGAPAVACAEGLPSREEIAATPRHAEQSALRKLQNLEQLALKLSDGIVAEQGVYERVVRDVEGIGERAPELADIDYSPLNDGRSLRLRTDQPMLDQLLAYFSETPPLTPDPLSCLDDTYLLVGFTRYDDNEWNVELGLKGIYDMQRVAAQYAQLAGVLGAEPATTERRGSTICLSQDGDTWHYVFDRESGDIVSGFEHAFSHYSTDSAGSVTSHGTPSAADLARYGSVEACR